MGLALEGVGLEGAYAGDAVEVGEGEGEGGGGVGLDGRGGVWVGRRVGSRWR